MANAFNIATAIVNALRATDAMIQVAAPKGSVATRMALMVVGMMLRYHHRLAALPPCLTRRCFSSSLVCAVAAGVVSRLISSKKRMDRPKAADPFLPAATGLF